MATLLYLGWGVLKIAAATRLSRFSVHAVLNGRALPPRYPVLKYCLGALQQGTQPSGKRQCVPDAAGEPRSGGDYIDSLSGKTCGFTKRLLP